MEEGFRVRMITDFDKTREEIVFSLTYKVSVLVELSLEIAPSSKKYFLIYYFSFFFSFFGRFGALGLNLFTTIP